MADQFINVIADEIDNLGHSWYVAVQQSPRIREDDITGVLVPNPPCVIVAPKTKDFVRYHAMNVDGVEVNIRSVYDVFFVTQTEGENELDPDHDTFITEVIGLFMPMPTSMGDAGAWQTRVIPQRDVDRSLFGKAYIPSAVQVIVDWIKT